MANQIESLLGAEAESLLGHTCQGIPRDRLHLPGPDFVDRVVIQSDRSPVVMRNLQGLFDHGRLGGTGYLSILPVDQGIEHSGGASFAPNPLYFDPENIVRLAIEGGCNAVASTLGVLGSVARRYAHRIPFLVKLNHNELLTQPTLHDQTLFASVQQAYELGAVAVGATVYYGSPESRRQIQEISEAFAYAHELGMVTFLWAYLRNSGFKKDGVDYHTAADLTGQANHLAATIEADIVKQKQAETNGGFTAIGFGKTHPRVYDELTSDHPVDLVRYQVANCYMGRAGLINSGGASGSDDLAQAVRRGLGQRRPGPGGAHRGHQQACRRHGADFGA
jgi:class I fructose-bisphosphate aldolase